MIMSSFLMNPTSYTEPKFPPTDEYSQSNYIPQHTAEYYRPNLQAYGYIPNNNADQRRYEEEKYTPTPVRNHHPNYNPCGNAGITNDSVPHPPTQPSPPSAHGPPQGAGEINGYHHQNSITPSPPTVPSPPGSHPNMSQVPCEQTQNGQPIIYPWMKKSQQHGGKCQFLFHRLYSFTQNLPHFSSHWRLVTYR